MEHYESTLKIEWMLSISLLKRLASEHIQQGNIHVTIESN